MITIVVPLDGSSVAEGVLACVENLAGRLHAEVLFVQSVDVRSEVGAGEPYAVADQAARDTATAEEYLKQIAEKWQARDIDASWEVVHGTPAISIVDYARKHKAYMIAMSTHGRSGLSRLVFGSVADQVLREAGMPVLLVKPPRPGVLADSAARSASEGRLRPII